MDAVPQWCGSVFFAEEGGVSHMKTGRILKSLAVMFILALTIAVPLFSQGASAADARGSIHLHARICPTSMPAGSLLFDQCHSHPGPAGAEFTVDNRQPKTINSTGNVSFGQTTAGDHLVTLTTDWQPNEFLGMRVFCSNLATGTGPNEATVLRGDQAQFW